ncbi:MAG: hypothetical protein LUC30_04235 [Clostridiales bacterium]|nr:hypothetical protein [Clostridiales bacterium]
MHGREIKVEIEQTMQSAFFSRGHLRPVYSKKESKRMKLKEAYALAFGACLRIDDMFANGCTYEEYACEMDRHQFGPPAQDLPRTMGFARWNEKVSIRVPYPPLDVTCCLYVTFRISESEKKSLPKMKPSRPEERPLPKKDKEWICPACGATSSISTFCSNCGRKRESKVVAKSNICYFDAKGEMCEKENATTFLITEYDKDGNLINSVHGLYREWVCCCCGHRNSADVRFCVYCGKRRDHREGFYDESKR